VPGYRHLGERGTVRALAFVLLLTLASAGPAAADDATMNAEIDFLLEEVAASGCTFIRNGSEHDADAARDHLALKRRRGRRYFDSADEFIERIASKSSWSGKPYRIRCEGAEVLASQWFTDALARFRSRAD